MNFPSINALWDIPQAPSLLPDDDFLALLQKQFNTTDNSDRQPHSPQSDDSSPSPPSNDSISRRHSPLARTNDPEDSHLKRKASNDDMDPGPSLKNHHTGMSHPPPISSRSSFPAADDSNPARKSQPPRRRSTGNPMVSPLHEPSPIVPHRHHSKTNPVSSSARSKTEQRSVRSENARRNMSRM